eukprot:2662952-Amphidinium_carterae.1
MDKLVASSAITFYGQNVFVVWDHVLKWQFNDNNTNKFGVFCAGGPQNLLNPKDPNAYEGHTRQQNPSDSDSTLTTTA